MKYIIFSFLFLGLFGCTSNPKKSVLPTGWRVADKEDIIDDWARFNEPNKIVGDFNVDGKDDIAQILLRSDSTKGFNLVVDVTGVGQYSLESNNSITPQSVAIEMLGPSQDVWESACEKGYWDCREGEIRNFKITTPSIQFCFIESACTVYIWSDRYRNFTKIPISD